MKFVALVSGGKDSIYSILECQRNGHELVACVHLGAPECDEEESYMYQTAASEVLPVLVEECLGVPLVMHRRVGKSVNTSLVYENTSQTDEVEDLYQALETALEQFPQVTAVSSGAILSTYQRVRIEHVCSRLGLTSLSYLWRMAPQKELLVRMLQNGMEAVLVKTACPPGLMPHKHLNKTLGQLYYSGLFQQLHDKYQFHMCGEGGEFETLVLDCPVYKKRLVLDEVEIVETEDGVGALMVKSCHSEDKEVMTDETTGLQEPTISEAKETETVSTVLRSRLPLIQMPHFHRASGGLFHLSEVMSPIAASSSSQNASEADLAVDEALVVFQILGEVLSRNGATAQDVVYVHLYLSEISHFANINAHYRNFFGTLLPPSRSCVAVGKHVLPGGRRVLLDCMVQCGSGNYMRSSLEDENPYANAARHTTTSKLREVLHVQSISHWAPVCVGPYSQANTIRSGLCFLAGQIGLIPSTMKLHKSWSHQFQQCWTNLASVLDAIEAGSLKDLLSCLVYVNDEVYAQDDVAQMVESISQSQFSCNGGITPGFIESDGDPYGGYEDEDTWKEVNQQENAVECKMPILLVSIPEMPVGALVELEVVCATQRSSSCLEIQSKWDEFRCKKLSEQENDGQWDTGYDFSMTTNSEKQDEIQVNVASRSIGHGCAGVWVVTAKAIDSHVSTSKDAARYIDIDDVLDQILDGFEKSLLTTSTGLTLDRVLHVRLYYISSTLAGESGGTFQVKPKDDGSRLRCALQSALAVRWRKKTGKGRNLPACTVVPVQGMRLAQLSSTNVGSTNTSDNSAFLAMQIVVVDPVHMETEVWIHHGRDER